MKFFNYCKRLCAVLLGALLLLSGIVKLMDPVGSALVMESYFSFLHLGFLRPLAGLAAFFFNFLECFVGVVMVSGIWTSFIRLFSLVLLALFTFLTTLLLIFNPEMDCGCFGEVMHLSHLQSFLKNLVLLALWAIAYLPWRKQPQRARYRIYMSIGVCVVLLAFGIRSTTHLPLLDLTDLHTGTELSEGQLSIRDSDGQYHDHLLMRGNVLLLSYSKASRMDLAALSEARKLALRSGLKPVVIVSGTEGLPEGLNFPVYQADRKSILSLNRSNGGASLICSGQISQKWSAKEFSKLDENQLKEFMQQDPSEMVLQQAIDGRRSLEAFILLCFFLVLV